MEDTFKKFLYTGVGMVTSTIEKVQSKINELVDEGKLTENEGRKVVDDLLDDSKKIVAPVITKIFLPNSFIKLGIIVYLPFPK